MFQTHVTEAANRDTPFFVNKHLSSFFSKCTLSLNGEKTSTTNANFANKLFFKTEFSYGNMPRKHGWLVRVIGSFGKIACDFLLCDKHLFSGVKIRLSFRRSPGDFVFISEDAAEHYMVQIFEANLYVRKMTVTDYVLLSKEKTLLKNPAIYNYIEVVRKTFLATAGVQSWRQEDVFAKELVRRMIVAMSINEAYLGTNRTNPFQYQNFGLNEIIVYRYGLPIAGTPVSTSDKKAFITVRSRLLILF